MVNYRAGNGRILVILHFYVSLDLLRINPGVLLSCFYLEGYYSDWKCSCIEKQDRVPAFLFPIILIWRSSSFFMNVHLPVEQPLFLHLSFGLEINHWSFSIDKRSICRRQEVLQNKYASHLLFLLFRYRAELLISVIMVLHIKRLYLKALNFFYLLLKRMLKIIHQHQWSGNVYLVYLVQC